MNRRQIVSLLGAAAVMGPALTGAGAALAQTSPGRPRRVGLMVATAENDPEGKLRVETFIRALGEAGWVDGRDVDHRCRVVSRQLSGGADRGQGPRRSRGRGARRQRHARAWMPCGPGCGATSIPIVFVVVSNPVGAGYVPNLSRPGANITGFSTFEPEIAGKWLQLLREVAPGMQNVSMLLDPKFIGFNSLLEAVQRYRADARHRPARRVRQFSGRDRERASRLSPSRPRPASLSVQARSIPSIASV